MRSARRTEHWTRYEGMRVRVVWRRLPDTSVNHSPAPVPVPQRGTATPPPQLAIQQGCVRSFRAQWPTWLRLREVRDEEARGQLPLS
jgi:hypothetical protein